MASPGGSSEKLEGLLLGEMYKFPAFARMIPQLRHALREQVQDLRSSVVKESCVLLCHFSRTLGSDFIESVEFFLPALFKLVVQSVQVISESSDGTTRVFICNSSLTQKSVAFVCQTTREDRDAKLRARCADYLLLFLETQATSTTSLPEPTVQDIESTISVCLRDADPQARASHRRAVWAFSRIFPERGEKLTRISRSVSVQTRHRRSIGIRTRN
eukprot:GABV01001035.1.p2 GENE.GABV01001035.1~~GABV01001035.1.p2  ORF type:complete len:216 (+),score=44.29 GABV01001035.1:68-715(+)